MATFPCLICGAWVEGGGALCPAHDRLAVVRSAVHGGRLSDWYGPEPFWHDLAMTLPPVAERTWGWRDEISEVLAKKRVLWWCDALRATM